MNQASQLLIYFTLRILLKYSIQYFNLEQQSYDLCMKYSNIMYCNRL